MAADPNAGQPENSGELRVTTRQQGNITTIDLAGEWDLAGAPAARHAVATVLDRRVAVACAPRPAPTPAPRRHD